MTDTFEYQAEKIAHRRCTQYLHNAGPGEPMYSFTAAHLLDFARELVAEMTKGQEPVVIDEPDYHYEAMGCGLEDRNITDRYEAMRYGWDCAVSRMFEQIPDEPLYIHPTVAAPVEWREQLETIADILEPDGDAVAKCDYGWYALHLKTGNIYRVTGEAIDATNDHCSRPMVIYKRDGETYVRDAGEFVEKFKAIDIMQGEKQ